MESISDYYESLSRVKEEEFDDGRCELKERLVGYSRNV
jgi:hypothetical protein